MVFVFSGSHDGSWWGGALTSVFALRPPPSSPGLSGRSILQRTRAMRGYVFVSVARKGGTIQRG